ncbi:hypothetical protein I203_100661 [Kwoniella mangroviensis CBS 8507]|uniref:uncharacterized protein n=1 Tax=Kwoniella mangroviensis CBS 8507 TaxID=1296122 RepID=UPI00080D765A|nr:uncharacterized protein I203_06804 [Kwoniella mangroviensis CBS 8507]OCF64220.1 hypothetical protein I203_06804 [Kwoniella mangroviensis CBS 8507]
MDRIPLILEPTLPSDYRTPSKPIPYRQAGWTVPERESAGVHLTTECIDSVDSRCLPSIISLFGEKAGSATSGSDKASPKIPGRSTSSDTTECIQRATDCANTIPPHSRPQVDAQQLLLENAQLRSDCQRSESKAEFWKGQYYKLHSMCWTTPISEFGFSDRPGSWTASKNTWYPANIPVRKFSIRNRGTGKASQRSDENSAWSVYGPPFAPHSYTVED